MGLDSVDMLPENLLINYVKLFSDFPTFHLFLQSSAGQCQIDSIYSIKYLVYLMEV